MGEGQVIRDLVLRPGVADIDPCGLPWVGRPEGNRRTVGILPAFFQPQSGRQDANGTGARCRAFQQSPWVVVFATRYEKGQMPRSRFSGQIAMKVSAPGPLRRRARVSRPALFVDRASERRNRDRDEAAAGVQKRQTEVAETVVRRRMARPIPPRPSSMVAQVAGSGTVDPNSSTATPPRDEPPGPVS